MPIELHHSIIENRRRVLAERLREAPLAGPIVLEIGSGHGHFLTAYAAAHPERRCVGIDLLPERIERAERKRERARAGNLRFLRAAADDFLSIVPADLRFDEIFLLFPDPWPKRRHEKNRLMRPALLAALAAHAEPGTRLHFRTDHAPYFAEARATIAASPCWKEIDAPWPFELPTIFQQRAGSFESLTAERTSTAASPAPSHR